ncbi:MAG: thrombospondin type 3 repeat-containing protein [Patescibacteria group bacterium]
MPSVNPLDEIKTIESREGLPRQQKMAVVFLAISSVAIIVIWSLQVGSQINKPFKIPENPNKDVVAKVTDAKLLDSDGDVLSDYDEAAIYKTSPYLEDSDSDGINDNVEIAQGSDPNCPTGKNCNSGESLPSLSETNISSTFNSITLGAADATSGLAGVSSPSDVTPAMLRQILLQNGYDQATVDKISDEDIMKSYNEALSVQAGGTASSTTTSQTTVSSPSDVTPAMLRQVLLQKGYDQTILDKISDADIMKSYQEALKTDSENPAVTSSSSSATTPSQ